MKFRHIICLLVCNLSSAQNTPAFTKLFRVFSAYDTVHLETEYDSLVLEISDIEDIKFSGLKKILVAQAKIEIKL